MKLSKFILLGAVATASIALDAGAADHYDGDSTAHDPTGDIADFYAFPDDDHLVLVMNVHPRAGKVAYFSDVIEYGFRIRPGTLVQTEDGVATRVTSEELRVLCTFALDDEEDDELPMTASCGLSRDGELLTSATVSVDDSSGGENPEMQVFAGLRADPFFTDAGRIRLPRPRYWSLSGLITTGNAMRADRIALGVRGNGPDSTRGDLPNVLSLVVSLDTKHVTVGPQLAVVAETNRRVGEVTR